MPSSTPLCWNASSCHGLTALPCRSRRSPRRWRERRGRSLLLWEPWPTMSVSLTTVCLSSQCAAFAPLTMPAPASPRPAVSLSPSISWPCALPPAQTACFSVVPWRLVRCTSISAKRPAHPAPARSRTCVSTTSTRVASSSRLVERGSRVASVCKCGHNTLGIYKKGMRLLRLLLAPCSPPPFPTSDNSQFTICIFALCSETWEVLCHLDLTMYLWPRFAVIIFIRVVSGLTLSLEISCCASCPTTPHQVFSLNWKEIFLCIICRQVHRICWFLKRMWHFVSHEHASCVRESLRIQTESSLLQRHGQKVLEFLLVWVGLETQFVPTTRETRIRLYTDRHVYWQTCAIHTGELTWN